MPIIIGAPRSGTTLLRFILDSHPEMAIPPETGFLALGPHFTHVGDDLIGEFLRKIVNYPPEAPAWNDFQIPEEQFHRKLMNLDPFSVSEGFRVFYQMYAARFNKSRWGDKTPAYCFNMTKIEAVLPEAHFIHLIRDGRDVALSLRRMWFSPGWDIETQAKHWSSFIIAARRGSYYCRHYMEVRYEDLILNMQETSKKICEFTGLGFDPAMLRYYERAPLRLMEHKGRKRPDGSLFLTDQQRIHQQLKTTEPPDSGYVYRWRTEMSKVDRSGFENTAGRLLRDLGYETMQS